MVSAIILLFAVIALLCLFSSTSNAADGDKFDDGVWVHDEQGDHYVYYLKYEVISESDRTVMIYDCNDLNIKDDYTVPNTVIHNDVEYNIIQIGEQAFKGCNHLTDLTIGDNVLMIGNSSFSTCTALKTVSLGSATTEIGYQSFNGCTSLISVTMGNDLVTIGSESFNGCISLRTIRLGDSVSSIGTLAFKDCFHLVEICNDSSLNLIKGSTGYGRIALYAVNIYDSYGTSVLKTLDLEEQGKIIYYTISLDTVLVTIDDAAQDITLPNRISSSNYSVMSYAFYSMNDLRSITLGSGVTSLGESAFASCSQLNSIVLNDGIVSIGTNAFSECYSLNSINIPDSVIDLGYSAFNNCIQLSTLTGGSGLTYVGDGTFSGCRSLTAFISGDNITFIGSRAFENCTALSKLIIGKKVDTLMNNAFTGCSGIKGSVSDIHVEVTATTVPSIGNDVFPAGTCISVPAEQLSSYKSQWSAYADTIYPDTYSVKFMNGSEVFSSYSAHYGDVITLPSTQPVKASTDKYDYRFKSWSGYTEGMTVTGNMTFNAEFEEIPKEVPGPSSGSSNNSVIIIAIIVIIAVLIIAGVAFFLIKKKHHE